MTILRKACPEGRRPVRRALACLFLAFVGAAPAACSGARENSAIVDPLASTDGFCGQWAKNACSKDVIANCAAQSVDSCVATQKSFCMSILPSDGYSPKFAVPCLRAVKDAYLEARLNATERETVLRLGAPCDKLIKGPGGVGSPCSRDADCNTLESLACVTKGSSGGTCQVPQVVGGGFSCALPQQTCATGFFCDGINCLARRQLDDPCTLELPCAEDLKCPAEPDGGSGFCVAKAEIGGSCSDDQDCKSSICAKSASASTGVCTAEIILRADDQICGNLR
jgi:hypothetical protein